MRDDIQALQNLLTLEYHGFGNAVIQGKGWHKVNPIYVPDRNRLILSEGGTGAPSGGVSVRPGVCGNRPRRRRLDCLVAFAGWILVLIVTRRRSIAPK